MSDDKNRMLRVQDEKLFRKAKIHAAKTGMTLIEITEQGLKLFFENAKNSVDKSCNT